MIQIEHLHKTYRSGFLMKPKLALKDVSFKVEAGQVYGYQRKSFARIESL